MHSVLTQFVVLITECVLSVMLYSSFTSQADCHFSVVDGPTFSYAILLDECTGET